MKKETLKNKLISFQKKIVTLTHDLDAKESLHLNNEKQFFLDIFDILDSFENIFNNIAEKENSFEKPAKKAIKSFRSISKKLLRILEQRRIKKIEFPDMIAKIGMCKIVETKEAQDLANGTIICIVRTGYERDNQALRPAEVITVSNK